LLTPTIRPFTGHFAIVTHLCVAAGAATFEVSPLSLPAFVPFRVVSAFEMLDLITGERPLELVL
jgi:hypothetical protein